MNTSASKCKLLNLRGNLSTKLNDTELHPTNVQKDLGLLITPNLTSNENCEIRAQKATRHIPIKTKHIRYVLMG